MHIPMETLAPIVSSTPFKSLLSKLGVSLGSRLGKHIATAFENFTADFEPHLKANYERCTKVKTILNKSEPIELLRLYVNTDFVCGGKRFDDYALIDKVSDQKRILVTGTGGGGKTIFMKYLWLSLFVNSAGRVPVFIELRNLNEITSDSLMSYIYHSIVDTNSKLTENYFKTAAREGAFIFILDGFDEVSREKRSSVQKQILKFANDNPEASIVVSGRPDENFESWQAFTNYSVCPLSKPKALQLIAKLPYDDKIRRKFSQKVKSELYDKHQSFLSIPLLVTMMLLTFDQFAEIPEKIFLFYDQAFDTLYLRHDFTKDGFKREKHTKLPMDVFKQYLSFFCLVSYYDEVFAFTDTEMLDYVGKAFKANGVSKLKREDFIKDLVESVCIMQKDGLQNVFTHRSFQEYFAAYCLSKFVDERFTDILEVIYLRRSDNVLPLLHEMDREKTEQRFVLPKLQEFNNGLKDIDLSKMKNIVGYFGFDPQLLDNDGIPSIGLLGTKDNYLFLSLVRRLYKKQYFEVTDYRAGYRSKDEAAIERVKQRLPIEQINDAHVIRFSDVDSVKVARKNNSMRVQVPIDYLDDSGLAEWIRDCVRIARQIEVSVSQQKEKSKRSIDEILGLTADPPRKRRKTRQVP